MVSLTGLFRNTTRPPEDTFLRGTDPRSGQELRPETPMQMRHEGSSHAALTSTVRIAGKLTVKADDRSGVVARAFFRKPH